jgi:uncharacterized protein (DUF1800 family)
MNSSAILGCITFISVLACTAHTRSPVGGAPSSGADSARALHALNRLTFGPRPADLEHVLRLGVERWIGEQLQPAVPRAPEIPESLLALWTAPIDSSAPRLSRIVITRIERGRFQLSGFYAAPARAGALELMSEIRWAHEVETRRLLAGRLALLEFGDAQLEQVMADFWANHFHIYGGRHYRESFLHLHRSVIFPNALGNFRTLLGAVVKSPSMLHYLDNEGSVAEAGRMTLEDHVILRSGAIIGRIDDGSVRRGFNENFARELLELHTLGVDGGYGQEDVLNVARALTGWTHTGYASDDARMRFPYPVPRGDTSEISVRRQPIDFVFDSTAHDADAKRVLGHALAPGRGMEDVEDVLDILASHPSTARFIARKLATRFVSDSPPADLVRRAAAKYMDTDGDIREVLRVILMSREFSSSEVHGAKVKSPQEYLLSLRRALDAPPDTAAESLDILTRIGQESFGAVSPDGWSEVGAAWMTVGNMKVRIELATAVASGEVQSIPVERWRGWAQLVAAPFAQQLNGVIRMLLHNRASANTRNAMRSVGWSSSGETALRELIALALASPEFQRR